MNIRYVLSHMVPVPMQSTYGVELGDDEFQEHASWWQWRGRIFQHRRTRIA